MDGDLINETQLQKELEEKKIEGINAYIDQQVEVLSQNKIWNDLDPHKLAIQSFQNPESQNKMLHTDIQLEHFKKFLTIATNLSSIPFAQKLQTVPELVKSISVLIKAMIEEVKEYKDIGKELNDIIHYFTRLVMNMKHRASMLLPILKATKRQLNIIGDVINPNQLEDSMPELSDVDKGDINLALNRMSGGMKKLLKISKSCIENNEITDHRINLLKKSVQSKKIVIENRLDIVNLCLGCSIPSSVLVGASGAGALIATESLGGVGALVVAGTAFPPILALVGACLVGGTCALSVFCLVRRFWGQRQYKALNYLNKTFESLDHLDNANIKFMLCMHNAEEKASEILENINDIQSCLESQRQWNANKEVCQVAIQSTTAMIEILEKISNLPVFEETSEIFISLLSVK